MGGVAAVAITLFLAIWASFYVARRVPDQRTRIPYYLLIWIVPVGGALAAVLIIGLSDKRKPQTGDQRMFDAVVDAHKTEND